MNDLITIIVPVYNVEPYLDRCIQSILNQTYSNLELILVDDKSADNSNVMCLEYRKKDERIVLIHGTNEGLSGARNLGLRNARGRYVIFIDSDDYVELDMVQNLYNCLIKTGADTVIGGFKRNIGKKIIIHENPFKGIVYDNQEDIKNLVLKKMLASDGIDHIEMSVWKTIFSMDIINKHNLRFPDKKYMCEDIIFDFQYYRLCEKLAMSNDTGYVYCLNNDSLSQMYQKNKFDRICFQTTEMKKMAVDAGFDNNAFTRIDNFFLGNSIHHMKTMASLSKQLGKEACLNEMKRICNDQGIKSVNWKLLDNCVSGRDKIPFFLAKKRNVKLLYTYLIILTRIRKLIRGQV